MASGAIAPFMTLVIGNVFNAFARFPLSNATQSDKDTLRHDVGVTAIELLGLAVGALALSSLTSSLWIWTGERNLLAVRKRVYNAVTRKDLVWFDTETGKNAEDNLGAGGLMAKFTRYVPSNMDSASDPKFLTGRQMKFEQLLHWRAGCSYNISQRPWCALD